MRSLGDLLKERPPSAPVLPRVLAFLGERLGFDITLAYRAEPLRGLEFCHVEGKLLGRSQDLDRRMSDVVRHAERFGLYDPFCPEPSQRDRARHLTPELNREFAAPIWAVQREFMGGDRAQLRMLICDGPVLLTWIGGFSEDPQMADRKRLLSAVCRPLRRHLILERRLRGDAAAGAFEVLLERFPGRAMLLTQTGQVVFANRAARAALDGASGFRTLVCNAATGAPPAGLERLKVPVPGARPHVLLLEAPVHWGPKEEAEVGLELSSRQRDVLRLALRGYANKEIAQALSVSVATVEFHLGALFRKLGVDLGLSSSRACRGASRCEGPVKAPVVQNVQYRPLWMSLVSSAPLLALERMNERSPGSDGSSCHGERARDWCRLNGSVRRSAGRPGRGVQLRRRGHRRVRFSLRLPERHLPLALQR